MKTYLCEYESIIIEGLSVIMLGELMCAGWQLKNTYHSMETDRGPEIRNQDAYISEVLCPHFKFTELFSPYPSEKYCSYPNKKSGKRTEHHYEQDSYYNQVHSTQKKNLQYKHQY